MIDNFSWEEDEAMQKRWASLLANVATLGENTDNYATFIEILRQLSPIQAKCLDIMYDEQQYPARRSHRALPSYYSFRFLKDQLDTTTTELKFLFDCLVRLNLIHMDVSSPKNEIDYGHPGSGRYYDHVSLTILGRELVKKCRVSYSTKHRAEIEKYLYDAIENIAKNPKGTALNNAISELKAIYEHILDVDVKDALWSAFDEVLWSNHMFDSYHDFPLKPNQKDIIIKKALIHFEKVLQ